MSASRRSYLLKMRRRLESKRNSRRFEESRNRYDTRKFLLHRQFDGNTALFGNLHKLSFEYQYIGNMKASTEASNGFHAPAIKMLDKPAPSGLAWTKHVVAAIVLAVIGRWYFGGAMVDHRLLKQVCG